MEEQTDSIAAQFVMAVTAGDYEVVELLIEQGADVNMCAAAGDPLLIIAMRAGGDKKFSGGDAFSVVAQYLVGAGADVNCRAPNGDTPLYLAIANEMSFMRGHLMNQGADKDALVRGHSLIAAAVEAGDESLASVLVRQGADPNVTDADGTTALVHAVEGDFAELAGWLLRRGADLLVRNEAGQTVFDMLTPDAKCQKPLTAALEKIRGVAEEGAYAEAGDRCRKQLADRQAFLRKRASSMKMKL